MIVQDGLRRMVAEQEDVFYYLTMMNENYAPAGDAGGRARRGSCAGCTCVRAARRATPQVQLLGSGTILREVLAGAELLRRGLRRRGRRLERHVVHRAAPRRAWRPSAGTGCTRARSRARSYVEQSLGGREGPVVAATDYIRALPDGIRPWVDRAVHGARHRRLRPQRLPQALRRFFEVDRHHVVRRRAARARPTTTTRRKAIERYGIDADAEAPWRR